MDKKNKKLFPNHLISIEELSRDNIEELVKLAKNFRSVLDSPSKSHPVLKGKTVVNLFFENSTRTRISFELAEQRLGCDIINFSASASSLNKGEDIADTILNIEAMKVDAIIVRSGIVDLPKFITSFNNSAVINAGDGSHEHPTQALLDVFSMIETVGSLDGKRVLILGDIKHSRVARSNIWALKKLGATVLICGPKTLLPNDALKIGVDEVYTDINEAIKNVDIINNLRVQLERQKKGLLPSKREYHKYFGLTNKRLEQLNEEVIIMHPGPINKGVEISAKVATCKNNIILEQVTNGVAMRMAILYKLLGVKNV